MRALRGRCSGRKLLYVPVAAAAILVIVGLWYSMNTTYLTLDIGQTALNDSTTKTSNPPSQPVSLIPKMIHFIYRDAKVIESYKGALKTCSSLNKDWQIILWTDDAIGKFMKKEFPAQVKVFSEFPHKIQRSDAIRYLILYKFGGLYMDLDMECYRPLLPSLSPYSCFIDRERQHQTQYLHGRTYSAMNSAMGCTAGHPFFRKIIDFVFHPDRLRKPFSFPGTIFVTTGPAMLTSQYDQWQKSASVPQVTMLNETYFSPKINPRSGIYGACRSRAPNIKNRQGQMSLQDRVCLELQGMGFEHSDDLFITNQTVAIHLFTHLGYYDQKTPTFNVTKEFPQVKSYFQLDASLHRA